MNSLRILHDKITRYAEAVDENSNNAFERCAAIRVRQAKEAFPANPERCEMLLEEAHHYLDKAVAHEQQRAEIHYLRTNR